MSHGQSVLVEAGKIHLPVIDWHRDKASKDYFTSLGQATAPRVVECNPCDAIAPDLVTVQLGIEYVGPVNPLTGIPDSFTVNTDTTGITYDIEWHTGTETQTARFDGGRSTHVCVAAWQLAIYVNYPQATIDPPVSQRPPFNVHSSVSLRSKQGHGMPQLTVDLGAIPDGGTSGQVRIPKWSNLNVVMANDNIAAPTLQVDVRSGVGGAQVIDQVLVGKTKTTGPNLPNGSEIISVTNNSGVGLGSVRLIFELDLS
jgi:hypothetical protein